MPAFEPDVTLPNVRRFVKAASMGFGRFTDHEEARKQGLPGAIAPGIVSQVDGGAVSRWSHASHSRVRRGSMEPRARPTKSS